MASSIPQCVSPGTLPLLSTAVPHDSSLLAPPEFEDVAEMVEWLILVESKLQPERLVVGDFVQLKRKLRDLLVCVLVCVCMCVCERERERGGR